MVATRRGRQLADSFFIGGDFGWFCPKCPTVVINPADVSAHLAYSLAKWDVGTEFAVLGIMDLQAVPPNKADLPLGEDDNPIPLVPFTRVIDQERGGVPAEPRRERPLLPRASPQRTSTAKKQKRRSR